MRHSLRRGSVLADIVLTCLHGAACGSGSGSPADGPPVLASADTGLNAPHPHVAHEVSDGTSSTPATGSGTGAATGISAGTGTGTGTGNATQPRLPLSLGTQQCARGSTPALSVYVGNDPAALVEFEKWMGRPVDALQVHSGARDWDDWYNSISWLTDVWKNVNRRLLWSIPLIPGTGTLAQGAKGSYDETWRRAARLLADTYPHQQQIYIRVGWEFNGPWKPWSSIGLENEYVASFRRFVSAFRSVSDRFIFEWTPNIGSHGNNPEDSYPGDQYVDLIGMDFYYDTKWHPTDNRKAWDYFLNQAYGLKWHQEFAARHKKQTAYSEWGFMTDGATELVSLAAAWFRQHGIVYQNYWNSNSNFRGKLSNNQFPNAATRFRNEFMPRLACR